MQEKLRREFCLPGKSPHKKRMPPFMEFNRSNGIAYTLLEFVEGASLLSTAPARRTAAVDEALKVCGRCAPVWASARSGYRSPRLEAGEHHDGTANGVAKIMDFGIARSFQGTGQMTALW